MRLIGLAVVIIAGVLAPVAAETHESAKVYRIGWLAPAPLPTTLDAFRDGLRVLGYVEGNNFAIEQRYGGLIQFDDVIFTSHRRQLVELAVKHQLPAMYGAREFVEVGGLISYGPDYPDLYRRSATYLDKIFRGAKPADLPVEQPTTFELAVNMKTARALGLTIPQTLLLRADEVIQ